MEIPKFCEGVYCEHLDQYRQQVGPKHFRLTAGYHLIEGRKYSEASALRNIAKGQTHAEPKQYGCHHKLIIYKIEDKRTALTAKSLKGLRMGK